MGEGDFHGSSYSESCGGMRMLKLVSQGRPSPSRSPPKRKLFLREVEAAFPPFSGCMIQVNEWSGDSIPGYRHSASWAAEKTT